MCVSINFVFLPCRTRTFSVVGLSCAFWNVQQQTWPLPTEVSSTPQVTTIEKDSRPCQMSPEGKITPRWQPLMYVGISTHGSLQILSINDISIKLEKNMLNLSWNQGFHLLSSPLKKKKKRVILLEDVFEIGKCWLYTVEQKASRRHGGIWFYFCI